MQYSAQLQAVTEVVTQWTLSHHKPFDHILNSYFKERRYIGSKDRQSISLLCYEIFRHKLILEWWAEWAMGHPCLETEKNYALKVLVVYLTLMAKVTPGEINTLASNSNKYGLPELTRVERKMVETLWNKPNYGKDALAHDSMEPHIMLNTPKWLYQSVIESFGEAEAYKLLLSLNQPASIDLRVNTLKGVTQENILTQLSAMKINAERTQFSPWGVRLNRRFNLNTFEPYKTGEVEIQDEGSQLLAWLSGAKPNRTVVDYCAGAGGKSLAMAMMMQNKGKLILCDTSKVRLDRSTQRLKRAEVFNVQQKVVLNTDQGHDFMKAFKEKADTVLIDAPCSGTGTLRRNPDARFRLNQSKVAELNTVQAEVLNNAASLVRSGGELVYATCSILASENQNQVSAFLSNHPEFEVVEFNFGQSSYKQLQLTPYQHATDGFFITKLKRK